MVKKFNCIVGIAAHYCAVLTAAGTWTMPTQISSVVLGSSGYPTTVFDPTTQAIAALWTTGNGPTNPPGSVYSAVSTDHGHSWQPDVILPIACTSLAAYGVYYPPLNTVVVTCATHPQPGIMVSAISPDGGMSWVSGGQVSGVNSDFNAFPIYDPNQQSIITAFVAFPNHPQVVISLDGAQTWGSKISVPIGQIQSNLLSSLNSISGNITAICAAVPGDRPTSNTSNDGGMTWGSPVSISSNALLDALITFNPVFNTTIASWLDLLGDAALSISTDDGTTWSPVITIDGAMPSDDVCTAVDPVTGLTVAAWTDATNFTPEYSLSSDGGYTWSPPATISPIPISDGGEQVFISFDPVGRAFIATWQQADGTPASSLFQLALPPPTRILTNQGGNLSRLARYLNSIGSSDPQVIAPLVALSSAQLEDALLSILPKPFVRLSAANTLLTMGDGIVHRAMERTVLRRLDQHTPLAGHLYKELGMLLTQNSGGGGYLTSP